MMSLEEAYRAAPDVVPKDNVAEFKRFQITPMDMIRQIPDSSKYRPAKDGKQLPYAVPEDLNMITFIVLCHATNILKHILKTSTILFEGTCKGLTILHYAAQQQETDVLEILLQCSWVQMNLGYYITPVNRPRNPKATQGTNALHLAVSHKRIKNAFMLMSDLPPVVYWNTPDHKPMKDGEFTKVRIKIDCLSEHGRIPLQIAVSKHDSNMVKLVLSAMRAANVAPAADMIAQLNTDLEKLKSLRSKENQEVILIKNLLNLESDENLLDYNTVIEELGLKKKPTGPIKPTGSKSLFRKRIQQNQQQQANECKVCKKPATQCTTCRNFFCQLHTAKLVSHSCIKSGTTQ
jgi:hypothetical protein